MIQALLFEYELPQPITWTCRGNFGGFSGSTIWKVSTSEGNYCLRRWPRGVDRQKLDWIHRVLCFARAKGCHELVVPIASRSGTSLVEVHSNLWELCRWAGGQADYASRPNPERLVAAIETVARFHQAAARFFLNFGPSENLRRAIQQLAHCEESLRLIERHRDSDQCVLSDSDWHPFRLKGAVISRELLAHLQPLEKNEFAIQPVIRDVRDEHFFFEGDRVCGLIDFGAMQIDTVACDLARMLGSMASRELDVRQTAMDQYSNFRSLSPHERALVEPMMKAGWLIGVLNWMRWLHIDKRQFDSLADVKSRVECLMESLAESA